MRYGYLVHEVRAMLSSPIAPVVKCEVDEARRRREEKMRRDEERRRREEKRGE